MNPTDIRSADPKIAVAFLDAGQNVGQPHLRLALANALQRIGELEERLKQIENRVLGRNAIGELED